MHDPFLKSVFADRRMVEILIHDHVPEWADEIDFSTLRQEPAELVARQTLQTRHPDMIWSADTLDGGRVLFLIEFQRKAERLMALRTTTYTALTLEGVKTMLELRGYTEALKLEGAKTMDELADRVKKGLDELVQRGARQGEAGLLRRQIARKFGEETAGQVAKVLEGLRGSDAIDRMTDALFESGTGEEFIERVRTA